MCHTKSKVLTDVVYAACDLWLKASGLMYSIARYVCEAPWRILLLLQEIIIVRSRLGGLEADFVKPRP